MCDRTRKRESNSWYQLTDLHVHVSQIVMIPYNYIYTIHTYMYTNNHSKYSSCYMCWTHVVYEWLWIWISLLCHQLPILTIVTWNQANTCYRVLLIKHIHKNIIPQCNSECMTTTMQLSLWVEHYTNGNGHHNLFLDYLSVIKVKCILI